jgi:hypothetical protein
MGRHPHRIVLLSLSIALLCSLRLTAQQPTTAWLKITDSAGGHDSLVFGYHQLATYCVDTGLGENYSPPDPPQGFWAVFLSIPGRANCFTSLGIIKKDLRAFISLPRKDTFYVKIANIDSIAQTASVTLRWTPTDCLGLFCDSMYMVDPSQSIFVQPINMLAQDSVVLQRVYDITGPNPSAPAFKFFIYVHYLPWIIDDCFLGPDIYTDSPTSIGADTATVNGRVVVYCDRLDSVKFQYGRTIGYGNEVSAVSDPNNSFHALLTGLVPRTIYHYRIEPFFGRPCWPSSATGGPDSAFTTTGPNSVGSGDPALPKTFELHQNFPNPFNPATSISFAVPKSARVRLQVFDLLGRVVLTLVDEDKNPGAYNVTWDASTRPSGLYFYRMTAGEFVKTEKAILIK